MIQAKLFVCCDSAALDSRTNAVSLFSVIEQLNAAAFPVAIPRLCIVGVFTREQEDPSTFDLQLQLQVADQQLFTGPINVNFLQQTTARTIVEMHGVVIPNSGVLSVAIRHGERVISSWSIGLAQVGQPQLQMFIAPPRLN